MLALNRVERLVTWGTIGLAVGLALAANTIATLWARAPDKFSLWLVALVAISPLVFITFGLVTARTGLVVSSGTIDSLLTISTILVALIGFGEWSSISPLQWLGLGCTVLGLVLLHQGGA